MKITLKAARINKGLSTEEVAKQIGVSSRTLQNWEKGNTFPDATQIEKIINLYHICYDDIIFLPSKPIKSVSQPK